MTKAGIHNSLCARGGDLKSVGRSSYELGIPKNLGYSNAKAYKERGGLVFERSEGSAHPGGWSRKELKGAVLEEASREMSQTITSSHFSFDQL